MVNELIGLQLITVITEGGERIDSFKVDYCAMETMKAEGLKLITVIWKPEGGERIDRFTADYCDMEN